MLTPEDIEDMQERLALGQALAERRRAVGLTQREAAALMDSSGSIACKIETFGRDFRLSTLQRYAGALGVRIKLELEVLDG